MDIYSVLKRPVVTEKSTIARDDENKYIFEVDSWATKIEIRAAIEKIFKVKVAKVNTVNVGGKKKRLGRIVGKRRDWKKAVVTLVQGNTIEVFGGV